MRAADLHGTIVDAGGKGVPNASVRLLQAETRSPQHRAQVNTSGRFDLAGVPAGNYLLVLTAPGFRESFLPVTVAGAQPDIDLGRHLVRVADCDGPDIMCDDFGLSRPQPRRRAVSTVELNNATRGDFRIKTAVDGTIWLVATKRANISEVDVRNSCEAPANQIRIDGFGRGHVFCVTTSRGLRGRLYLLDEVGQQASKIMVRLATQR